MEQYYTDERNVQILIALLKSHGIKRIVASPGSTNVTFVGSLQQDSYFEMYSCVDERSAAYMACGLAAETLEPVVLSCTGATASRNYFSALTEAYYRGLPILAVTSTQEKSKIGNLIPQVIDRSVQPHDILKFSVHLQTVKDEDDEWDVTLNANKAILELNHHGSGPVHINLTTRYSRNFKVKELPKTKKIMRYVLGNNLPELPKGKIAIYVGSHGRWTSNFTKVVDEFCEIYNAVVFTDPTANYYGKYRAAYELMALQKIEDENKKTDLIIHIGMMSDTADIVNPKEVWRVCEDGKLADRYKVLSNVFEMPEQIFFEYYIKKSEGKKGDDSYIKSCREAINRIGGNLPELPFSHIWVASQLFDKLPQNSTLHLGILSPLRSWSYFTFDSSIEVYCNQGGFGIDGNMSSLVGASLANLKKLYFGVVGDLSFFYDINILGNRHIGNNVRILLINNALGAEFHLFKQLNSIYVDGISKYISAGGHFGHQSLTLVKHYVEDLGFKYLRASNKEEFEGEYKYFISSEITDKPMVFEVFTQVEAENEALRKMMEIEISSKNKLKNSLKNILGESIVDAIKKCRN